MTYRGLSLFACSLCLALTFSLIALPGLLFWVLHVGGSPEAAFVGRRAAMLFLGLATITYLARDFGPSEPRMAISAGTAVAMAAVACLGLIELLRGFAGMRILLPIAVETAFAVGYARFALADRRGVAAAG